MEINSLKKYLKGDTVLAIAIQNDVECYSEKGIKVLLLLSHNANKYNGAVVADRVIGKAAAFILVYMNIKEVYCDIISTYAKKVFEKYNVRCTFGKEVDYIINRTKTGMCPMESKVLSIESVSAAMEVLRKDCL